MLHPNTAEPFSASTRRWKDLRNVRQWGGFPVALVAGLPLALLAAWPLRRVRDQRLHVVAFAVALGAVMAGYLVITGEGRLEPLGFAAVLLAAACGAIGRASVIKLVARRNQPAPD